MRKSRLRILQVSTADVQGGAERVAWGLFETYRALGHASWLAVGCRTSDDPDVLELPHHRRENWLGGAVDVAVTAVAAGPLGRWRARKLAHRLSAPHRWVRTIWQGAEDFHFPGTQDLLFLTPQPPDVLHCHNLHGDYFDLGMLPQLARQVPVVLTLHDAWLLSGHCAHSLGCERWRAGCGQCPDLRLYPSLWRDGTAANWRRKQRIYQESRLAVATPCAWLMRQVKTSMLWPGVRDARVIPYGVDCTVFQPGDRVAARAALGLPVDGSILLFAANGIRRNPWKDVDTLRAAIARIATQVKGVTFVALGDKAQCEAVGSAVVQWMPYERDRRRLAQFYRAADLYVHAAHADTFPNVVLEALACGTPVVATAVGGIPEQVRSLATEEGGWSTIDGVAPAVADAATGILVAARNATGMAQAAITLLNDPTLRHQLGRNAAKDARERFDQTRQAAAYLDWYEALLGRSDVMNADRGRFVCQSVHS